MKNTKFETLDELVEKRKGYKFLNKDRTSPYFGYKWVFRKGKVFRTDVDIDVEKNCASGWNLATIDWILNHSTNILNKIIVEFSIPKDATIVVPTGSDGKFRTDIVKYEQISNISCFVPQLKDLAKKIKNYKPINPINATEMPHTNTVMEILDKVDYSNWDSVRNSVGNSVWDSVGNSVRNSVRNSVWYSVRNSVGYLVRYSVGYLVRYSVGNSVWNYCDIIGLFAIKELLNLEFEHPVFDIIRLGIMPIKVNGKIMIYGKDGMLLGEI